MPSTEPLTCESQFQSSDSFTNRLLVAAVEVLLSAIINPATPPSPISYLPRYSYQVLDEHLRRTYLPQQLSESALEIVSMFLPIDGNWNTLLDLASMLTNKRDQVILIGAVAYIEAWSRFNPLPTSSGNTPRG